MLPMHAGWAAAPTVPRSKMIRSMAVVAASTANRIHSWLSAAAKEPATPAWLAIQGRWFRV